MEEVLWIICVTLVPKKPYGNIEATFNLKTRLPLKFLLRFPSCQGALFLL